MYVLVELEECLDLARERIIRALRGTLHERIGLCWKSWLEKRHFS